MKAVRIFFLSIVLITTTLAQLAQLHLAGKPELSPDEFSGVRDANGRLCAAIQVISDMSGFKYQSYNGVVRVDHQPGKDMVYLSPDERVLEIYKDGYAPLKIILSDVGIYLKEKQVWKITITGEGKTGDVLPVTIIVQPADARIEVDGKMVANKTPVNLTRGLHQIRIFKEGYKPINKTIQVSEKNVLFNFSMEEVDIQPVTIRSVPKGATIFINNIEKGLTDKGLFLYPGVYDIKLTLSGYLDINEKIEVKENQKNEFVFNLTKNSGTLVLNLTPSDAGIFINKEDYSGKSTIELAPGMYKLEVKKAGYYGFDETIKITRGQTLMKNITLTPKTGRLQFSVQPVDARVVLKKDGKVIRSWTGLQYIKDLHVGSYELECSAPGYKTFKKTVRISENQTIPLDIVLEKGSDISGISSNTPPNFVFVKGGWFEMGDTFGDGDGDEKPVHRVYVDDFLISKYEVTQKEWEEIMGDNPSFFKGDNLPVEVVSWYEAIKFCNEKSKREGLTPCYTINGTMVTCDFSANGYRLPTEAEWEYAAKGGQLSKGYKYAGSNNPDDVAWYKENSGGKTHPVGTKQPNELGIYDMSGNVWEWCWDWYDENYYAKSPEQNPSGPSGGSRRVRRGGSWRNDARRVRSSDRFNFTPVGWVNYVGFRLVRKP